MRVKLIIAFLILCFSGFLRAQDRQSDTTRYRTIIPTEKQNLMKNVDIIANTQMGFRNDFQDGEYLESKFKFEQFRLEIKGYVHEKVYFRFRHRYTSTFEPQTVDKIIKGVDFAYLRFDISDKLQFTFGKTYADWGGMEFDLNPIDIYEYSDIIEMADNFLFGAELHYTPVENQTFGFQIINSRTGSFEELYDSIPTIEASKIPLGVVVSWRGSLFDGKISTLWSYSVFNEADGIFKNYFAIGNQLNLKKFTLMYDFKISVEDLDRTGIISNEVPDDIYNYALKNTVYYSHWLRLDYRFKPKWQISLVGIYDKALWMGDVDPQKNTNDWRTAYTFIPTLEFFPYEDLNLKFFFGGVYRNFDYSDYSASRFGLSDYSTGRIIFGIISPLNIM